MKQTLVSIRDYQNEDENFIFATWLQGLWHGNDWFREIDHDTYFSTYRKIIQSLLKRPSVSIKIACLKDDPSVILSYAVSEGETLHFIFTKEAWRKNGIATMLIPKNLSWVTHLTPAARAILRKKYPNVKFNPFL